MQLVKLCFAVVSLTDLLVWQKLFIPVRAYFGWVHDDEGNRLYHKTTNVKWRDFFGTAIGCFRCTSVWVAIILVVLSYLPFYKILELILVGSWGATLLNRLQSRYS
jgi:hypothetical protein